MSSIPISKRIFQFVVIHTIKGFHIVNEAELDAFLEFPCFLYDPANVGNMISGSSAFSKPSLNIWKFSVHVMLKPSLKDFEHFSASMYSLVAQMVKSLSAVWETWFNPWIRKMPWRRKWPITPIPLPGKSHGQRNLAGYSP